MRYLLTFASLFALSQLSFAQEKKFFLTESGTVELRLSSVESKTKDLEARIAQLEKALASKPVTAEKPIEASASKPVEAKQTRRVQVCNGSVCYYVDMLVSETTGSNCPMGYCPDCQCAGTTSSSWYPGKFFGRRR